MDKLESVKKTTPATKAAKPRISPFGIRLKHSCHIEDCDSVETLKYGYEIGKPTSCAAHRTPTMFKVYYTDYCKTCIASKSFPPTRAKFGRVAKKPEFCAKHNIEHLPDVITARCEICAENDVPLKEQKAKTFGMPDKPARWCKEHAPEGAVTKYGYFCECSKLASIGFPGGKPTCCSAHAEDGMVRLKK